MKRAEFSYKKLWKLLIDRDMKKKELSELSGVSGASIAKLGKDGNVTTEVLFLRLLVMMSTLSSVHQLTLT